MDDAMKPDDDVDPFEAELDDLDDRSMIHHVDAVELRSLGVVAGLFYFTAFLVLALAVAGVYLFAASLGLISQVEDFMRSVGFRGFKFVGPEVILGFVLILAALVVFLTVMTLVAGAFYNLLGTGKHGVRFRTTVVEARGRRTRRVYDDEAEAAPDDEVVAATAPLAEQPAAAAAVAAAPLAAAVDEETSIDDWVKAPGDDVDATAEDGDDEAKAPAKPKAPARKQGRARRRPTPRSSRGRRRGDRAEERGEGRGDAARVRARARRRPTAPTPTATVPPRHPTTTPARTSRRSPRPSPAEPRSSKVGQVLSVPPRRGPLVGRRRRATSSPSTR